MKKISDGFSLVATWIACWLLFCPLFVGASGASGSSVAAEVPNTTVQTPHVKAELIAYAPQGVAAGQTVWLGLSLTHIPGWHTYWKNPGDSGIPTTFSWQLPKGVSAGEVDWPAPEYMPLGPLLNYGYKDTVLLPVPLKITNEIGDASRSDELDVKLRADWLVCEVQCIPESGEFHLKLQRGQVLTQHAQRFAQAFALRPRVLPSVTAQASVKGMLLEVQINGLPSVLQGKPWRFFAAQAGVIDHGARIESIWRDGQLALRAPLSAQRSESPATMEGVITLAEPPTALQIQMPVQGGWPRGTPSAAPVLKAADFSASSSADSSPPAPNVSLALAVVLAFFGGLLLNLMPCVFPVLSLKIIGFAQHAQNPRARIAGGLAYTAGVILTFSVLAMLLLLLRSAGEVLGWGFQLQSPIFVSSLAILFVLIGLNLAGVFEIGNFLPSGVASFRARRPLVDDALTGVLAVLVASPCTAPFMGVGLGAALTMPPLAAMAVFIFLAMGMAAPYLAATLWPGLGRLLPKPGRWMVQFKVWMALPMFATALWLMWVLAQQLGVLSAAPSPSSRWQAWSPAAMTQAAGRPILVDFTAAWCVTCQYNKRTTLADSALLAELDSKGMVFLRADWTARDENITQALAQLGRGGVPVYAVYAPGATTPVLLPEILSIANVRAAVSTFPTATFPTSATAAKK
jgi:thiol:disulfide interchange protein DsbD